MVAAARSRGALPLRRIYAAFFMLALSVALPALGAESFDDGTLVGSWIIDGGNLVANPDADVASGDPGIDPRILWRRVEALIPKSYRRFVVSLEIFSYGWGRTGDLDAYTYLLDDGRGWAMAINREAALSGFLGKDRGARADMEWTVVHELGHVVALNYTQMDPAGAVKGTFRADEGVLRADSLMNGFWASFWKGRYGRAAVDSVTDDAGAGLYAKHRADFTTEYAASGPTEDFAESFARFVTEGKPGGRDLVSAKLSFFWRIPEMVAARREIRAALKGDR